MTPYSERSHVHLGHMKPTELIDLRRQVAFFMRASLVNRYHNRTTVVKDTVGRHTFMMMWLIVGLSAPQQPRAELLLAALDHDVEEAVMGDITAPVKRLLPHDTLDAMTLRMRQKLPLDDYAALLNEQERLILKLADKMEALVFSQHELVGLGNTRMAGVVRKIREYLVELLSTAPEPLRDRATIVMWACESICDYPEDEEDVCL